MDQQVVVVGVAFAGVVQLGPAGAVDAGSAAQGINFEAAVVGEGVGVEFLGVSAGFETGVLEEASASFFDGWDVLVLGEVIPFEFFPAEHVAKFTDLSGIGRGYK